KRLDGQINRWFCDPLFKGQYPVDMLALYGKAAPEIRGDDMKTISTPLDFRVLTTICGESSLTIRWLTISPKLAELIFPLPNGLRWAGRSTRTACMKCCLEFTKIIIQRSCTSPKTAVHYLILSLTIM